jgi:hypothetical protein
MQSDTSTYDPRLLCGQSTNGATIVGTLENALHVVVATIKETTEMRRKMHADQPEE